MNCSNIGPILHPTPLTLPEQDFASAISEQFQRLSLECHHPDQVQMRCYEHVTAQGSGAKLLNAATVFLKHFPGSCPKRKFTFAQGAELLLSSFIFEALKKDCWTFAFSPDGNSEDEIRLACTKDEFLATLGYLYPEALQRLEPGLVTPAKNPIPLIETLNYLDADKLERAIVELKAQIERFRWESSDDMNCALRMQQKLKSLHFPPFQELLEKELASYFGMALVVATPVKRLELLSAYKAAALSHLSFCDLGNYSQAVNDHFLQQLGTLDRLHYLNLNKVESFTACGLFHLPVSLTELQLTARGYTRELREYRWLQRLENLKRINLSKCDIFDRDLKLLPRSLMHLDLSPPIRGCGFSDLPPKLERLSLVGITMESGHLGHLPRTLKELDLRHFIAGPRYGNVRDLPPGLIHLRVPGHFIPNEMIPFLPQGLTTLEIYDPTISNEALKRLPQSLRKLVLWEYYGNSTLQGDWIKELPRGLEVLELKRLHHTGDVALQVNNLPPKLERLDLLGGHTVSDEELLLLPRSLRILSLSGRLSVSDSLVAALPPGLKHLALSNCCVTRGPFPPRLTHLKLKYCPNITDETLVGLPEELVSLKLVGCHKITDVALSHLPKQIVRLSVQGCSELTEDALTQLPEAITCLTISYCNKFTKRALELLSPAIVFLKVNRNNDHFTYQSDWLQSLRPTVKKVKARFLDSHTTRQAVQQMPPRFSHIVEFT